MVRVKDPGGSLKKPSGKPSKPPPDKDKDKDEESSEEESEKSFPSPSTRKRPPVPFRKVLSRHETRTSKVSKPKPKSKRMQSPVEKRGRPLELNYRMTSTQRARRCRAKEQGFDIDPRARQMVKDGKTVTYYADRCTLILKFYYFATYVHFY